MRLAQLNSANSQQLLATALKLDRYNSEADIELGLQYEAIGEFGKAEHSLLQAFAVDHTYLPRWSLANYYFRRGNMPAFWTWARRAAAVPSDEIGSLFELCWHVSPNPNEITAKIGNDQPKYLRQYVAFLETKDQLDAAAAAARKLIHYGNPEAERGQLFSLINRLVAADDANAAVSLWHSLVARRWVDVDATQPNNGDFARQPLPVAFDWSFPHDSGMYSWPGRTGLETDFSGDEAEKCTVAEQTVALAPGNYTLHYAYQTSGIAAGTGIRWQIVDVRTKAVLATSADLSSEALRHAAVNFTVPQDSLLLRVRLGYQRAVGTSRISGTLYMQSARIQPQPSS